MKIIYNDEFLKKLNSGSSIQLSNCDIGTYYKRVSKVSSIVDEDYRSGDVNLENFKFNSIYEQATNKLLIYLQISDNILNLQETNTLIIYVNYSMYGSSVEDLAFVIINADDIGNIKPYKLSISANLININLPNLPNIGKIKCTQDLNTSFLEGPGQIQGINLYRDNSFLPTDALIKDSFYKKLIDIKDSRQVISRINSKGEQSTNYTKFRKLTSIELITFSPGISITPSNEFNTPISIKYYYEDYLISPFGEITLIESGENFTNSLKIGQFNISLGIIESTDIEEITILNNPLSVLTVGALEAASFTLKASISYFDRITDEIIMLDSTLKVTSINILVREYTRVEFKVLQDFDSRVTTVQRMFIDAYYYYTDYSYSVLTNEYISLGDGVEYIPSTEKQLDGLIYYLTNDFPDDQTTATVFESTPGFWEINYESNNYNNTPFTLIGEFETYSHLQGKTVILSNTSEISAKPTQFRQYTSIQVQSIDGRLDKINGGVCSFSAIYNHIDYYITIEGDFVEEGNGQLIKEDDSIKVTTLQEINNEETQGIDFNFNYDNGLDMIYKPTVSGQDMWIRVGLRLEYYDLKNQENVILNSPTILLSSE